jgi:hypothetical protein
MNRVPKMPALAKTAAIKYEDAEPTVSL